MLAAVRATLETYCQDSGRPLDTVKRWFRKLTPVEQGRALRNFEVAHARRERGIVGDDTIRAPDIATAAD